MAYANPALMEDRDRCCGCDTHPPTCAPYCRGLRGDEQQVIKLGMRSSTSSEAKDCFARAATSEKSSYARIAGSATPSCSERLRRLASSPRVLAGGPRPSRQVRGDRVRTHQGHRLPKHLIGVAPLVVVPAHDLVQISVDHSGEVELDNGGAGSPQPWVSHTSRRTGASCRGSTPASGSPRSIPCSSAPDTYAARASS